MQVKEVMTKRPQYLDADATIREAAEMMRNNDSGFEPLVRDNKIIGTVTDRDITIRAVAEGKGPDEKVSSIATEKVLYTFEDVEIKQALKNMQDQKVQRLVVLNNSDSKDLVGVLSVGDVADHCQDDDMARQLVNASKHYH
jgi:CBS domain-containing protein